MEDSPPDAVSRRTVLKAGGALASLAAVGSMAGCQEEVDTFGSGDDETDDPTAFVPQGAEIVTHVDVASLLGDDAVRESVDEFIAEQAGEDGPQSIEDALDRFEEDSGFDARAVTEVLAFWSESNRITALVWADLTTDELVEVIESEATDLEEEGYADRTLYVGNGDTLAPLSDGVFAVGPDQRVRDAVDVWDGDADPVGGTLVETFGRTEPGYVRTAAEMPDGVDSPTGEISSDVFEEVTHVYGSVYADGENRIGRLNLQVDSSETAEELADGIAGLVSLAQRELENDQQAAGPEASVLVEQLDSVETRADGDVAVVEYRGSAEEFGEFVAQFAGLFLLGFNTTTSTSSATDSARRSPQVAFSFDYQSVEDGRGRLRITHDGGDTVDAENLRLVGRGFADVEGTDQTASGPWQGSTRDGEIAAGDAVTVGVESSYEMRVVWEDENQGAVLAQNRGPDA